MLVKQDQKFNPPDKGGKGGLNPIQVRIKEFAEALDIPVTGVTLLGGNPYVNKTGLLYKAHKIGLYSITVEELCNAKDSEQMRAGYKATVTMKDKSYFEATGWGSPQSVQMKTLQNPDYINMTTETRAKNRALGLATGYGHISAEEIEGELLDEISLEIHSEQTPPPTNNPPDKGGPRGVDLETPPENPINVPQTPKPQTALQPPPATPLIRGDKGGLTPEVSKPKAVINVSREECDATKKDCLRFVNEDTFMQIVEKVGLKGKKLPEYTQTDLVNLLKACKEHKVKITTPKAEAGIITPSDKQEQEEFDPPNKEVQKEIEPNNKEEKEGLAPLIRGDQGGLQPFPITEEGEENAEFDPTSDTEE